MKKKKMFLRNLSGTDAKEWGRRFLSLALCLLMLTAFPVLMPTNHTADASVRSNFSYLIRKILNSSNVMQNGQRYLGITYKGETYRVSFADDLLYFRNTEKGTGSNNWRTDTILVLNPKTLSCTANFYYTYSSGGKAIARAKFKASSIRKGWKAGYNIDTRSSTAKPMDRYGFIRMSELDLPSVMMGWDRMLADTCGLRMRNIGFSNWPPTRP